MLDFQGWEAHDEPPAEAEGRPDGEAQLHGLPVLAEDRDRVGPERHERAVRQGDLARVAEREVEPDGQDQVDERETGDVELVLLEDERQEPAEEEHGERQEAAAWPRPAGHEPHSSFTPHSPSGFHRSTAIRITRATASRKGPEAEATEDGSTTPTRS